MCGEVGWAGSKTSIFVTHYQGDQYTWYQDNKRFTQAVFLCTMCCSKTNNHIHITTKMAEPLCSGKAINHSAALWRPGHPMLSLLPCAILYFVYRLDQWFPNGSIHCWLGRWRPFLCSVPKWGFQYLQNCIYQDSRYMQCCGYWKIF